MKGLIIALAACLTFTGVQAKEDDHKHEAKAFASVNAGLTALDQAIAEAKAATASGKLDALHEVSEELHSIATGLKAKTNDVAADAKDRFKFNVDQIQNLHEQLEDAEHGKNKADAERVIKRLEDVSARLKALAPN
jgi:hypothetical protein